jgi:hypothetical protein
MRSTAVLISAGAGALPTVSGISEGMPIPLNERKIRNWTRQKGGRPQGRRPIQINAEMDAGRGQLVVVGRAFKNFSHVREQNHAAGAVLSTAPERKCR